LNAADLIIHHGNHILHIFNFVSAACRKILFLILLLQAAGLDADLIMALKT